MATFLTDTFTDTAATTLASHTRDDAGSWTAHGSSTSNLQISASGTRVNNTTVNATALYYASGTPATAEYDVEAILYLNSPTANASWGPCARLSTSANTCYHVRYVGSTQTWQLYKIVTGTLTLLDDWAEPSIPIASRRYVFFHCTDAAKDVYINGVLRMTSADNAITAAGRAGIRSFVGTGVTAANVCTDYITAGDSLTMTTTPTIRLVATEGLMDSGAGLATDGEELDKWNDQGPSGLQATAPSSGFRPRLVIDDDGSSLRSGGDALATSAAVFGTASEFTWTVVVRKPYAPASAETLASEGNTGEASQTRRFDVNTNGTVTFYFKDDAGTDVFPAVTSTTNICDDEPHVITAHSTGGTLVLRIDGVQEDSDTEGTHDLAGTTFNSLGVFHHVSSGGVPKYATCDLYVMEGYATPVANVATHDAQFVYTRPANLLVSRGAGSPLYTSAIRYVNTYDRTYIGWQDPYGRIGVTQIQNSTGTKTNYLIDTGKSVNRHNSVALAMRSDHKLLAFWTNHNTAPLQQYIATNAEDASAWGSAATIENTSIHAYPQTATTTEGSNGHRIYVYFRNETDKRWEFIYSDDNGGTWQATAIFWDPTTTTDAQIYLSVQDVGGKIHFAATSGDPAGGAAGTVDLYHFYYDGAWRNSTGTSQTIPITEAKATLVFDSSANGNRHPYFTFSMRENGNAQPMIAFSGVDDAGGGDRSSYRARFDGSTWTVDTALTLGAGTSRLQTTSLDPFDDNVVYYDKDVSGMTQLVKATTANGGANWTETQITSGTHHGLGVFQGPQMIFAPHSAYRLIFKQGLVNSDSDYSENLYFYGSQLLSPPPRRPKPVRFFRR